MQRIVYPGSFDPPTYGHLNIIQRASRLFDQLEIVIADNKRKKYFFTADERFEMITEMVAGLHNVQVNLWNGLIVDFVSNVGARVILRGVRALADFEYEFELSLINKGLNPQIETIFMPTDKKYFVLRSSAIKELAMFNGDVSSMVPPVVARALKAKLNGS
jgi:pantetheine-phosphate adenylyltransferase